MEEKLKRIASELMKFGISYLSDMDKIITNDEYVNGNKYFDLSYYYEDSCVFNVENISIFVGFRYIRDYWGTGDFDEYATVIVGGITEEELKQVKQYMPNYRLGFGRYHR